ncbi:hypothetical protein [Paenibacillus sp. sgz500992]|uniref:hypothetical protein n=1 Tax=Paenibacillus sp. sgz500992 TaxID=3242476 RepID=UPI0036D220A4
MKEEKSADKLSLVLKIVTQQGDFVLPLRPPPTLLGKLTLSNTLPKPNTKQGDAP